MKMKRIALILMAALLLGTAPALALPICQDSDVTGTNQCRDGIPNSSNDSESVLNDNLYFGFDDWNYLSKQNVGDPDPLQNTLEGPVDIGLAVSPISYQANTGTWSFDANLWNTYTQIMIVLKDGGIAVAVPDSPAYTNYWSAYLLNDGIFEGDWTYPMGKDLSHLSVYGRGTAPVPEPATMLLLGSGLIGLAGFARKKKIK